MGQSILGCGGSPTDGHAVRLGWRRLGFPGAREPGPRRRLARPRQGIARCAFEPGGSARRARIDALRRQIAETEGRLNAVAARIDKEFPDYAALAHPKPLTAEEVQKLLGADEALVFFLVGANESYVFALTREGFEWRTISLGEKNMAAKVAAFRRGLDVEELTKSSRCWKIRAVRSCCRTRALRCAPRAGRGADQGQAPTPHRAVGPAHRVAIPSAGDGQAGHCSAAAADQRYGRLPRCRLGGEAACGHRAAVSRKPEGFARVRS